jgi:hypothetical protein
MCVVWMFVEPLAGRRSAPVTLRKTAVDWAHQVREVVEAPRYAQAERITLVCANLNVHRLASLYEAFAPEEALRLARKIELVHTPKSAHWPTGTSERACPAMGRNAQPTAGGNRLAISYRRCTDKAYIPLPKN